MAVLNSNPEILLRKRKNADRKRLEKQEQAREKLAKQKALKKKAAQAKFIRAETLVSNFKSNELEAKRIKNINKKHAAAPVEANAISHTETDNSKLLFLIRVPLHTKGLKIPNKAKKLLTVLKLTQVNTGVFVKANESTFELLSYIAPYIIIGQPSLNSKIVKLDNNQLVEDKFGDDLGLICIEDIIHQLTSLSDNFTTITSWLLPFKLNPPVNGWGPQAKLAKLIYKSENTTTISLSRDFKLQEVEDIDSIIDQQN
jgi:large subunit ribosomal protein L7e